MKTIYENQNIKFAIITIAILIVTIWFMEPDNSLNKCQETYSFDTCFTSLNRQGREEQNVIKTITIEGNLISIKEYNGLCCTQAKWFTIDLLGI